MRGPAGSAPRVLRGCLSSWEMCPSSRDTLLREPSEEGLLPNPEHIVVAEK